MSTPSTPHQRALLHVLMNKALLPQEQQKEIKLQTTQGRTDSSKLMTYKECQHLIDQFLKTQAQQPRRQEPKPGQAQRRKILAICRDLNWFIIPGTDRVSIATLNEWLVSKGTIKKELNRQNAMELNQTVTQLERIYTRSKAM